MVCGPRKANPLAWPDPGCSPMGPRPLKDAQAQQAWQQQLQELFDLHQALTAVLTEKHWLTQRDLAQQQVDAIRKRQKMGDATGSICCKSKPRWRRPSQTIGIGRVDSPGCTQAAIQIPDMALTCQPRHRSSRPSRMLCRRQTASNS